MTYFGPALCGSGPKSTTFDHGYFIPSNFHQNRYPSSGSGEEVENVKVYCRRRRRTARLDNSSLDQSTQVSLKRVKILTLKWKQKINKTSSHMHLDPWYAFSLLL